MYYDFQGLCIMYNTKIIRIMYYTVLCIVFPWGTQRPVPARMQYFDARCYGRLASAIVLAHQMLL